jgi:hypothetical protein
MTEINSEQGAVSNQVHTNGLVPKVIMPPVPKPGGGKIWPPRRLPPTPAPEVNTEVNTSWNTWETKPLPEPYFNQLPTWQHGQDVPEQPAPTTNEPAAYRLVDVQPGETLADLTRRVYGSNNVINRLRIELANGGKISGTVRIPK